MVERFKEWIKELLKIPSAPEAPFGEHGSIRVFRAAPGFFRYRMLRWTLQQLGALIGIVVFLGVVSSDSSETASRLQRRLNRQIPIERVVPLERVGLSVSAGDLWALFEILAIAGFAVQLPFTFLMVFLDYEYRWYITTDRSLRIREGLVRVDERTMTFSNVQNLSVKQGPLQRFFGISDLEVSSAGGGGSSSGQKEQETGRKDLHRAYFRGIANPAEIRDAILVHLRSLRASGLGDPDEESQPQTTPTAPAEFRDPLAAARDVLQETRALRQALS